MSCLSNLRARKLVSALNLGNKNLSKPGQPGSAVPVPRSASPAAAVSCAVFTHSQAGQSPDVQGQGLVLNGYILLLGGCMGCAAGVGHVHNLLGRSRHGGPALGQWIGSPEENVALLSRNFLG